MIISLRRLAGWAKFLTAFIVLTLFLYQAIAWITYWVKPSYRYGEPKGGAVKVYAPFHQPVKKVEERSVLDRLRLFYWMGE